MTIEATLERIAAALERIAENGSATPAADVKPSKPAKTTKEEAPKAEPSPQPETESASDSTGSETTGEESKPSGSTIGKDEARHACVKLVQSHGPEKLAEVLDGFNVKNFSGLSEDQYGDLMKAIEEAA